MDKETLSNYGWIVICILVLAVMIALATPFGKYIATAVENTTQGLFDVSQKAGAIAGLNLPDQSFEDSGGSSTSQTATPCATFTDGVTLSWEELKLAENGTKYGYSASLISDTEIGIEAFYKCASLESITLPDSVKTIGESAFASCTSLANVDLGNCTELTNLGVMSFASCTSLESIDLRKCTALTTICNWTFAQCPSLESITLPNSVETLGDYAFWHCNSLENITLPTSIESIGVSAFYGTSLGGITLPASVETIGEKAFYNCPYLTTINFAGTKAQWETIGYTAPDGVTVNCMGE